MGFLFWGENMTFQELKQLKNDIAVKTGLDTAAAARVIGYYNGAGASSSPDIIQAMINGDMSPVGPALVALGINGPDNTPENITDITPDNVHTSSSASAGPVVDNITAGTGSDMAPDGLKIAPQRKESTQASKSLHVKEKTTTSPTNGPQALQNDLVKAVHDDLGPDDLCKERLQDITQNTPSKPHNEQKTIIDTLPPAQALPTPHDDLEHVQGESVHALPPGLYDDICALIDNYCRQHDISDPLKIHPLQWQGICYRIGESIKSRRFIHDHAREKIHGGTIYDGEKLAALLDLYGVICSDFKQVAFTFNFARFAGVSTDYLHDYMAKGLTSSRVGLREKALNLQKSSLAGAVTGGGSATVGNIFLSKALAGMSETVTIQRVTTEHTQIIDTVPDLSRAGLPGPV